MPATHRDYLSCFVCNQRYELDAINPQTNEQFGFKSMPLCICCFDELYKACATYYVPCSHKFGTPWEVPAGEALEDDLAKFFTDNVTRLQFIAYNDRNSRRVNGAPFVGGVLHFHSMVIEYAVIYPMLKSIGTR